MSRRPDDPAEDGSEGTFDQPEGRPRRGRAIGGDRACETCGTKLSLYNPGPHCWQHTVGWPWRGPAAKPRY